MTDGARAKRIRVLHVSDIHCGRPYVAAHVDAAMLVAREISPAAIVVSGDMAQRARIHEFEAARPLLAKFRALAPTIVVPGNHDTAWWRAPFGVGDPARLHERYRRYIDAELEPTLRVPGVSMIGLNSSVGMLPHALAWYPRHWRVKGGLTDAQLAGARERLSESPRDDLRILVVHHNVMRGALSNRWGLTRPLAVLDAIALASPHVVCTGHDHQERVEVVSRASGRFIAACAGTLSNRMRGHRPSSVNVIESDGTTVAVTAYVYRDGAFVEGPMRAEIPV